MPYDCNGSEGFCIKAAQCSGVNPEHGSPTALRKDGLGLRVGPQPPLALWSRLLASAGPPKRLPMIQPLDKFESVRVAVVGAGLAGLACARWLSRQSVCEVTVFEKSRGPGGRCALRSLYTGRRVAIGAPSLLGNAALWRAVESQLGIVAGLNVEADSGPLRMLAPESQSPAAQDARAYGAADGHLAGFIDVLAADLDVRYQRRVEAIERDIDSRWYLTLRSTGDEAHVERAGPFDALILALPEPQAVALLAPAERAPLFAAGATAVKRAGLGALQTWLDAWPARASTWQPVLTALLAQRPPDQAVHAAGSVATADKPQRLTLGTRLNADDGFVIHAPPHWSQVHFGQDAATVLESIASAWHQQQAFGHKPVVPDGHYSDVIAANSRTLAPVAGAARPLHRWRYAFTTEPLMRGALWESVSRLGVCGDWLDDGTGGGALRSGLALVPALQSLLATCGRQGA